MKSLESHPCFGGGCRGTSSGRIHLPVSPACNIRCRFCARAISQDAPCPGNAARVVTPEEAMAILGRARDLCPELAVVGVAGPGDPLATDHAVETLSMAHARFPDLIPCLSTNGLGLPMMLPRLLRAGLRTLTVTVNAVDPAILERLNGGVIWNGRLRTGRDGARRLIASQERGIRQARLHGLVIKTNMVLVPGINDGHVEEVARTAAGWGSSFMNIIPLLPAAEFAGMTAPDERAVEAAREAAGRHIAVFRHCRRCRADACGIPGVNDFSHELYRELGPVETFSHG